MKEIKRYYYYWNTNQIQTEIPFLNGKWHGIIKQWNVTGELSSEFEYQHGIFKGVNKVYNINDTYSFLFTSNNQEHGVKVDFYYGQ